jgi:hypothetical protein
VKKILQKKILSKTYTASASTATTSGTIRFSKFSIPAFNVIVLLGQPLQLPFI